MAEDGVLYIDPAALAEQYGFLELHKALRQMQRKLDMWGGPPYFRARRQYYIMYKAVRLARHTEMERAMSDFMTNRLAVAMEDWRERRQAQE